MGFSKKAQRAERLARRQQVLDRRKAERRQSKLERRRAARAEQARASVLVADTVDPAPDQRRLVGTRLAYSLHDLQQKNLRELQHAAKGLGIKGYSGLRKDELVEFIYQHPANLTKEYA